MSNDGGPAFPQWVRSRPDLGDGIEERMTEGGMSLRDYFAGQALPAIIARVPLMTTKDKLNALPDAPRLNEDQGDSIRIACVKLAYDYADLMINRKER